MSAVPIAAWRLPVRAMRAGNFGTLHGNGDLQLIDVLIVMLASFFNPLNPFDKCRTGNSQRLLEALSTQEWMTESTGIGRIPPLRFIAISILQPVATIRPTD